MASYEHEHNRLTIKLVYYGPALSGKTTNLMRLHDMLRTDLKGEIMIMETTDDRTLFFDLLPLGFTTPKGLLIKFKLFTVPGQVIHDSTRKAVLSRSDGVVFVADSQLTQSVNNGESFENLEANAWRVGLNFDHLPLVVQYNKRDLTDIITKEEVLQRWRQAPWPVVFSSALTGQGVVATLQTLLQQVYDSLAPEFNFQQDQGLTRQAFVNDALGLPEQEN
ncbi:GTPase domain-containing protein [Methylomarinum sp. Ch1-1]|uniref:GTPase domain-containing protein n=1 Tax=Methylomarinum roseum TaxID=3067653 RepID=A0AAU7NTV2_9GAMM|nr:GTPase domain-containing protein [Methylomarinum sp. Ch1-1]MDP4519540.1 GTPase domain-containing protein [Methylomarinum sp. Ch1-1]